MNNTRPFDVPVATAVDFVGLIYLLILSVHTLTIDAQGVLADLGRTVHNGNVTLCSTRRRYPSRRPSHIQVACHNPHRQSRHHVLFHIGMFSLLFVSFSPRTPTGSAFSAC